MPRVKNKPARDYTERPEFKPLIIHGPTQGEIYLKGFADGYHARPQNLPAPRKARAVYMRGYQTGKEASQAAHHV